jgi:hypothetical protein
VILTKALRMYPPLADAVQVGAYAGLRPAGRSANYVIERSRMLPGLVHVAAIRSTGLSAALGIARHVAGLLDGDVAVGPVPALRAGEAGSTRTRTPTTSGEPWWRRTALHRGIPTRPGRRCELLAIGGVDWDEELLAVFGLERRWLPPVGPTFGPLGILRSERWGAPIALRAQLLDQQAALAGSGAVRPGELKATYGTGVFVLGRTERRLRVDGLLPTVAWAAADAVGGVGAGVFADVETAARLVGPERVVTPLTSADERARDRDRWREFVGATRRL